MKENPRVMVYSELEKDQIKEKGSEALKAFIEKFEEMGVEVIVVNRENIQEKIDVHFKENNNLVIFDDLNNIVSKYFNRRNNGKR